MKLNLTNPGIFDGRFLTHIIIFFSGGGGGGENQSAVLVPIDEAEKKGEGEEGDEEEGPEEVALDWWSKYFASKENQCEHGNKDGDCDAKGHSDEEEGGEDAGNEGKTRFKCTNNCHIIKTKIIF